MPKKIACFSTPGTDSPRLQALGIEAAARSLFKSRKSADTSENLLLATDTPGVT